LKSVADQLKDDGTETPSKKVEEDERRSVSEVEKSSMNQDNGAVISSKTSSRDLAASGQSVTESSDSRPIRKPDVAVQINTNVQGEIWLCNFSQRLNNLFINTSVKNKIHGEFNIRPSSRFRLQCEADINIIAIIFHLPLAIQ
jgi:hypothetical protein